MVGCRALVQAIGSGKVPSLQNLNLTACNKIGDEGCEELAGIVGSMEKVWLWGVGMMDNGCQAISRAASARDSKTMYLYLQSNFITDATSCKYLSLCRPAIKLFLAHNKISDDWMVRLDEDRFSK